MNYLYLSLISCHIFFFINRVLLNERYSNYIDVGRFYYYFCKDTEQYMFREQMMKFIEEIPENLTVLDYGSGPGIISEFFKKQHYYGVDIDKTRVLQARRMYGCDEVPKADTPVREFVLVSPPPENLPFPDNFFDIILSNDFLHHVNDEDAVYAVSEMNRVIRPDGIIFIREPRANTNVFTWLFTIAVENGYFVRTDIEYLKLFDVDNNYIVHTESYNFGGIRDYFVAILGINKL